MKRIICFIVLFVSVCNAAISQTLATAITGTVTVCAGATTMLSDATAGGTWSSSNTTIATVNHSTGAVKGVSGGTATISYIKSGARATRVVTVNPLPATGTISGTATVCTPATTLLSDATVGGAWSSTATAIATVTATGIVRGVSAGTATISYTLTNSCGANAATKVVTVSALPAAGTITGTGAACPAHTVTLSDAVHGGTWSSTTNSVATVNTSGKVTGVSGGTAIISYTLSNTCGSAAATTVVTVNPMPVTASLSGATGVCIAATTLLTASVSGGTWSSTATAKTIIDVTGLVTGVAAGTSTIKYTLTNTCGTAVASKIITVTALPAAGSISGTAGICIPGTTTLTKSGTTGGTWSSTATGVAVIGATGLVTGVSTGTSIISYTLINGCGSVAATKTVSVNLAPVAGSISGAGSVCLPGTTALTIAGNNGAGLWSSSSTSKATINTTGLVTGVAAGTATIKYTVTNTCGTTAASKIITVNALPAAGSVSGTATICLPGTVTLSKSGSAGGTWSSTAMDVALVGSTGIVTGIATGIATISYTLTNDCGSVAATKIVSVNEAPVAGTITGPAIVCMPATNALSIMGGDAGGVWSSTTTSNAVVSTTGTVSGVSSGTSTIRYKVTNSCGNETATMVVTVNAIPVAGTITGNSYICLPGTAALSMPGGGGAWSSATNSVATVSTGGTVRGVSLGTTTISYTLSNICGTVAATKIVSVNSLPVAGTIAGTAAICLPGTIALSASVGTGIWSSVASDVATVDATGIVTGASPGTSLISYTSTNVCGTTVATGVVTINAIPTPSAITGITIASIGGAGTALSNSVTGGIWSSTATAVATVATTGVVTGVTAGTTTISYTVTNSCGTATVTTVVTVSPVTVISTGTLVHGKIPIDAKRWYQLNNVSNGLEGLFDSVLDVSVLTGWGKILDHYDAYYPVLDGEQINIDSIKFYDGEGTNEDDPFTLYYIDSLWNRVQIATFVGTRYNDWVGPNPASLDNYNLAAEAHNVKYLVINCSGTYPNEMMLFGSYIAPNALPAAPAKSIKLKQEFGVNGFEWDLEDPVDPSVIDESRMTAAKSFTAIRHYLDWQKLEPTEGGYTYNPSHEGSWNYDTMYARCKTEGIEVLADIKTLPDWMIDTYPSDEQDAENVPVPYGSDFSNPTSYLKQAKAGFQFAARYGNNPGISSSLLSVDASTRWTGDPVNTIKKGLGLIKYIECDNERDKWWKGRAAYQTGREYAANLSAFYDGNRNTMGPGVGVKNADSTMQVVMAGVASPVTDYFRGMIDWCKEFRGYKADGSVNLCWDVINYHIYPNDGDSRGMSPEAAHADLIATDFVTSAHIYAKDMPVWVTETGYDINQGSTIKAIPIGSKTAAQTQADWTLRNSLLYARCGVERTFFYEMYDDDTSNPTNYSSSGFINPDHSRKPEADYLYQANKLMGEYVYKETISANPLVDRYELNGHSAYALVKPSENGSTTSYSLPLPGFSGIVHVYNPAIGQDSMSRTAVTATGTLALTVTETPMFVIPDTLAMGGRYSNQTNVLNNEFQQSVVVYPNPTAGNVVLTIDNENDGDVSVTVYNAAGMTYKNYEFTKQVGKFTQTIDISSLPGGLYFMDIVSGNEKAIRKIIKVNL